MHLPNAHYENRRLATLVENRTVYQLATAELNVYETRIFAEAVELRFNSPVLASMLTGKKVMHLSNRDFEFFPGESVVLPAGETMRIDFPEANLHNPTQCLALALDDRKIDQVVNLLNEKHPRLPEHSHWQFAPDNFHFTNDEGVKQIMGRLIWLFTENHPSKDVFADFMLNELIIRLLQTEARHLLLENASTLPQQSRLAAVIQYIRSHLHEPLTIPRLSRLACLSETHFFRCFKQELGLSPVDFINAERIKLAQRLLKDLSLSIHQVAYDCGFNNISYFNKCFKRATRLTPTAYRQAFAPGS